MRLEVHLHGYIELCEGVSQRQVETALLPLFYYLDVENMAEVFSLEEDQPGIRFNQHEFTLEICCTLEVGNSFFPALEEAMNAVGLLAEQGAAVEVVFYHPDGRDEMQMIFIGPTPSAIYDVQRRRMIDDVSSLLRRQFDETATSEVVALVNDLFRRQQDDRLTTEKNEETTIPMPESSRRRLH